MQDFGGKALFFAQQAEQQMLGANVLMAQAFGFLGGIGQHALALITQREIDRRGNFLPDGRVSFNLLANGFDRSMGPQKSVGQRFVFTQQAEKQVFGLNIRRAELACLIACKKDYAPGFLCVPLEHVPSPRMPSVTSAESILLFPWSERRAFQEEACKLGCLL